MVSKDFCLETMTNPTGSSTNLMRAASLATLEAKGRLLVQLDGQTIALFYSEGCVYARTKLLRCCRF